MKNICKRLSLSLAAILLAAAILTALIKPAAAESGFTGMQIQGMSQQTASALGLKSTDGVLVRDVALGGPADKAGIKRGDLILNYGGQRIDSFKKMMAVAGITKPGQEVKVSILREGKPVTLTMKLGK